MPFLYLVLIGIVAAIIDTTPMILRKMNPYAIASAFVFHLTAPAICYFIYMPSSWLKGASVYLVLVMPILILVAKEEKKAVPIVAVNTLIIGILVGWVLSFIQPEKWLH